MCCLRPTLICLFLIFVFLGFLSSAFARVRVSGQIEAFATQYGFQSTEDYSNQNEGLKSQLQVDYKAENNWRFRSDTETETHFERRDQNEKNQIYLKNLYLENHTWSMAFRLGYQTLSTGGTDFLNPVDSVHSKSWLDPSNPHQLSSLGVSVSQEINQWEYILMFIPTQTKPRLPGEHSPWFPREKRLPIESESLEIQIPPNVQYQYLDSVELNSALKNNYAVSVQRKSESFEAQALYYEGLSQDPFLLTETQASVIAVDPKLILLVQSPVKLRPLYFRKKVLAVTALVPLGTYVFRWGGQVSRPVGSDERIPYSQSMQTASLEKSFETSKGLITWILQYQMQTKDSKEQISFLKSIFERAWAFGFRIPWGEDTQYFAGVIYDLVGHSSMIRASASRRLTDQLSLQLKANFLQGPESTLLGLYDKYDHETVSLIYHF